MEAGGKDCEDETLQTAFKKLRVDAESVPGAVSVCEAPRASRPSLDPSGAKPKLSCPKDNWHGCMRKSSRGASRTQRRRRSKSPILHPPKFTYCSAAAAAAVSPPSGCLKQQRLAVPDPSEPRPPGEGITASSAAQKELSSSGSPNPISPLVFGSCAGFEAQETSGESSEEEKSASEGARVSGSADFRVLSERLAEVPCSCVWKESGNAAAESPCRCRDPSQTWQGVEVYSFTGLRNATSECERTIVSGGGAASSSSSGSARSCSEQARVYVDDITIEDLSGYMEYYLYIPKKMSHMAEMMYT